MLAEKGKILTELEQTMKGCLHAFKEFDNMKKTNKTTRELLTEQLGVPMDKEDLETERIVIKKGCRFYRREMFKIFWEALRTHDSNKIREMADAMDVVLAKGVADKWRSEILLLKRNCELTGSSGLTVREVAQLIDWQSGQDDGFPQLRRLCKELGYPLAHSRQIRRK